MIVVNLCRAMVVNAAQLATYSQAKQMILGTGYVKVGPGRLKLGIGHVVVEQDIPK